MHRIAQLLISVAGMAVLVPAWSSSGSSQTLTSSDAGHGITLAVLDLASVDRLSIDEQWHTRGIDLIMNRATIGVGDPDPVFAKRLKQSGDFKFLVGAYHVPFPTHSGEEQAKEFVRTVRTSCIPGQKVLLAVDWEPVCIMKSPDKKSCALKGPAKGELIQNFIDEVRAETGASTMIYTSYRMIKSHRTEVTPEMAIAPLWYARYHGKSGFEYKIPSTDDTAPWRDWEFWQYGEGKGPDVTTRISVSLGKQKLDLSMINGERSHLPTFFDKYAWVCSEN